MRRSLGFGPKLGGALLLAAMIIRIAGRDTAAQVPAGAAEQQLAQLRDQVASLEHRIAQLEKEKGGVVGVGNDTPNRDPRFAQVDQRLAALEQAAHGPLDVRTGHSTLTAPFTIVDAAGKPIMQVTDAVSGTASRGIYVFSASGIGASAHIGILPNAGGRVYVAIPGNLPEAGMSMSDQGPQFSLNSDSKTAMRMLPGGLYFYGTSGSPIALFGSKGDRAKGYLEINDGAGNKMVEAGSLDSHKGYVLASPYKASTAPTGDPSVLKGGGGK